MKYLPFIFLLLCCISCGRAQNEPVRPGDRSDFFVGRWTVQKCLYEDQVLFDVSDRAKPFRDSVEAYAQKGIQLSQSDSIRIMNNINNMLSLVKESYIEFEPGGKVIARMVIYDPVTPRTATLEGIYEVDYHKLRIEFPDDLDDDWFNPAGAYTWFYKGGQLLLFRNYQSANETCDVYERVD